MTRCSDKKKNCHVDNCKLLKQIVKVRHIAKNINSKQKAKFVITRKDIGTSGYVITRPGVYQLKEDVVFSPTSPLVFNAVTFTSTGSGSGAAGFAAVSGGIVRGVYITNGGTGYLTAPTITFPIAGTGATGTVNISGGGVVTSVTITAGGSGYRNTVQAAITIAVGSVTLILADKSLSQLGWVESENVPNYGAVPQPSSQVPFVVGILIPDAIGTSTDVNAVGKSSIYIEGDQALINGFSMYGIRCFAHMQDIQMRHTTVKNCGNLASHYLRPYPSYRPHSIQEEGVLGPAFGVGGIAIGEATYFGMGPDFFINRTIGAPFPIPLNRLSQVILEHMDVIANFCHGYDISNTTDVYTSNSHFDRQWSDEPGQSPGLFNGIVPINGNFSNSNGINSAVNADADPCILNAFTVDCTFNGAYTKGDKMTTMQTISGISVFNFSEEQCYGLFFRNCQFNSASDTFLNGYLEAYESGSSSFCTYINCSFDGNTTINSQLDAFHRSGANTSRTLPGRQSGWKTAHDLKFVNCTANYNKIHNDLALPAPIPPTGGLSGFTFFSCQSVVMESCEASDNVIYGPVDSSPASHLGVAGVTIRIAGPVFPDDGDLVADSNGLVFRRVTASRNQTMNGGKALGWRVGDVPADGNEDLRSVLFEDCEAFENIAHIPTMSGQTQSVGIGFQIEQPLLGTAPGLLQSYPVSLKGCKAYRNSGLDVLLDSTGNIFGISGGMWLWNCRNASLSSNELINNSNGIVLTNCSNCAIRSNTADSNHNPEDNATGSGFVDTGATGTLTYTFPTQAILNAANSTPILITVAAAPPSGAFVTITGSPNTAANGSFLIIQASPTTFYLQGTMGNGTSGAGGTVTVAPIVEPILNVVNTAPLIVTLGGQAPPTGTTVSITGVQGTTSANGTFVITNTGSNTLTLNGSVTSGAYAPSTPANVGFTTSTFELNHAFNNGTGVNHTALDGPNSNYDVLVNPTNSVPILEGQVSTAVYTYLFPASPELPSIRNVSMIA